MLSTLTQSVASFATAQLSDPASRTKEATLPLSKLCYSTPQTTTPTDASSSASSSAAAAAGGDVQQQQQQLPSSVFASLLASSLPYAATSPFLALCGRGDDFLSSSDLMNSVKQGIHLEPCAVPTMEVRAVLWRGEIIRMLFPELIIASGLSNQMQEGFPTSWSESGPEYPLTGSCSPKVSAWIVCTSSGMSLEVVGLLGALKVQPHLSSRTLPTRCMMKKGHFPCCFPSIVSPRLLLGSKGLGFQGPMSKRRESWFQPVCRLVMQCC